MATEEQALSVNEFVGVDDLPGLFYEAPEAPASDLQKHEIRFQRPSLRTAMHATCCSLLTKLCAWYDAQLGQDVGMVQEALRLYTFANMARMPGTPQFSDIFTCVKLLQNSLETRGQACFLSSVPLLEKQLPEDWYHNCVIDLETREDCLQLFGYFKQFDKQYKSCRRLVVKDVWVRTKLGKLLRLVYTNENPRKASKFSLQCYDTIVASWWNTDVFNCTPNTVQVDMYTKLYQHSSQVSGDKTLSFQAQKVFVGLITESKCETLQECMDCMVLAIKHTCKVDDALQLCNSPNNSHVCLIAQKESCKPQAKDAASQSFQQQFNDIIFMLNYAIEQLVLPLRELRYDVKADIFTMFQHQDAVLFRKLHVLKSLATFHSNFHLLNFRATSENLLQVADTS